MNENIGEAVFIIRADDSQAISTLNKWSQKVSDTSKSGMADAKSLSSGFEELGTTIAGLAGSHFALSNIASGIESVTTAFSQYESSMNGVKAVAEATGNSVTQSFASIEQITKNGLINQDDAAAAMKNLQAYGYSVDQATQLITVMADAAAYNRQSNYSLSEAVRVTTEGIRMENSVLSDAAGVNKNIAKMQEDYAKQLGKTTANLTNAEKAQAVYNGFMEEGSVFSGNAAEYTNTLSGAQQKLDSALTSVKQTIGAVFANFAPIVSAIADWIANNKELVAGITTFVGIIVGAGGLIVAITSAVMMINKIRSAMTAFTLVSNIATGNIAGFVAAAAALSSVAVITQSLQSSFDDLGDSAESNGAKAQRAVSGLDVLGGAAKAAGKEFHTTSTEVTKLSGKLDQLTTKYRRDLKQIAVNHEKNLQTLTQQIEEANIDYKRAIDERTAEFNVTLAKQEKSHQETVDELMTQLTFLQRYNNDYNKQKLLQVQSALQIEQKLYEKQTEAQKVELELQNEADRQKHEEKLKGLQDELDDEMAFMAKHREALNYVRGEILLDEIESLNERYAEQQNSYSQQIETAHQKGAEAAEAYWNAYNKKQEKELGVGLSAARAAIDNFKNGITKDASKDTGFFGFLTSFLGMFGSTTAVKGYDTGGYTGRGATNEVAGVVHRGEYVVPASQVDQSTGLPMMTNSNITINLEGVLADSPQAKRKLGMELAGAVEQVLKSRLNTGGAVQ